MFKNKEQVRKNPFSLSMYQIPLSELDFNKSYCLKFVKIIVRAVTGGACPPPPVRKNSRKKIIAFILLCALHKMFSYLIADINGK